MLITPSPSPPASPLLDCHENAPVHVQQSSLLLIEAISAGNEPPSASCLQRNCLSSLTGHFTLCWQMTLVQYTQPKKL
ncbi:hypothetical protein TYRP_005033 [Tyrophagus putrescentiae]|nr:hypothetical protein TYRP_005033 [Tyrophagus putrescentiae]